MFDKLQKILTSPDTGGSFGSNREVFLEDGKDILARSICQGIGVFIQLGGPPNGKEFVLPLSGKGQGGVYDDTILSVGGLVRKHGTSYSPTRDAYPIKSGADHWDTIAYIHSNEREHFGTPFIAVGKSTEVTNHPDLRHVTVESAGINCLNKLGLFYPVQESFCRSWARNLIDIVNAVESSGAQMNPSTAMRNLISDLRSHIKNDDSNAKIADSLAEYEKLHGDRPHGKVQVPEFIRSRIKPV